VNTSQTASERIIETVAAWPDVTVGPGKRGASVAFRVGQREIGHLHGDHAAHFNFQKTTWDELRGRAGSSLIPCFRTRAGLRPGGSSPRPMWTM
jgi:hypothetical protein